MQLETLVNGPVKPIVLSWQSSPIKGKS